MRRMAAQVAQEWLRSAATLDDILGHCGPEVLQKGQGVTPKQKRFAPDKGLWLFSVAGSKGEEYHVRVKAIPKGNLKDLAKVQILCSCSCQFWRWQGPEHWARQNGYLYGKPRGTASKPVIKDPAEKHWGCKHIVAVLNRVRGYRLASTYLGASDADLLLPL